MDYLLRLIKGDRNCQQNEGPTLLGTDNKSECTAHTSTTCPDRVEIRRRLSLSTIEPPKSPRTTISWDDQTPKKPHPLAQMSSLPESLYWKSIQERNTHSNLRRDFASQRALLNERLERIVTSAHLSPEDDQSASRSDKEISNAESLLITWQEVQKLVKVLQNYESQLETSDKRLDALERRLRDPQSAKPSSPVIKDEALEGPDDLVEAEPNPKSSENSTEALTRAYYIAFATVRHVADELVNLGPRPVPQSLPDLKDERELNEPIFDDFSSPEEYDERHIKLLEELQQARTEYSRLNALCAEKGISFDEHWEEEPDGDYQDILNTMEIGAPRIDALLATNVQSETEQLNTGPRNLDIISARGNDRIASWLSNVSRSDSSPHSMPIDNPVVEGSSDHLTSVTGLLSPADHLQNTGVSTDAEPAPGGHSIGDDTNSTTQTFSETLPYAAPPSDPG